MVANKELICQSRVKFGLHALLVQYSNTSFESEGVCFSLQVAAREREKLERAKSKAREIRMDL